MISVIIPVYNGEKFISRAVNSVLGQSYKDFELIIVNDGSTDLSYDIIKKYKSKQMKIINQENHGPAAARNKGIEFSTGEYITFLDQDDEYRPEKLERQYDFLKKNKEYEVCYCNVIINDLISNKRYESSMERNHPEGFIYKNLYFLNPLITPGAIMFHRNCLRKKPPFKIKYFYAYDYEFYLRISKQFKFGYLKTPLIEYYLHGENNVLNYDRMYNEVKNILQSEDRKNNKFVDQKEKNERKYILYKQLEFAYNAKKNNDMKLMYSIKKYKLLKKYDDLILIIRNLILIKQPLKVLKYISEYTGSDYDYKLLFYKGVANFMIKKIDKAELSFIECIKKNQEVAEVKNNLGCIYLSKGKTQLAGKYFKDAILINCQYNDAIKNIELLNNNILNAFHFTYTHMR